MRRARAIGEEFAESERQTEEMNASLERWHRRRQIARELVQDLLGDDGDFPDETEVESVDGGYWVTGRVFVDADSIEHVLATGDASSIEADPMAAQRRGE
jgi:hypothetical protein